MSRDPRRRTPRSPAPGGSFPVVPPVVLSTTFGFDDAASMARAAATKDAPLYTRWTNPTLDAVETRLAELEGAERALVTGSGMAAISLALLTAARFRPGGAPAGPLVVQREVYGGTHELAERILPALGVPVQRVGLDDLQAAARDLPPGATLYTELPTNPTVRVFDLPAVADALPPDALLVVDATFATPVNLRPLEHGADLVVHSATKYLAGHHDVLAGVVAGPEDLVAAAWSLRKLLGPVLDPSAAYRLWRGLETLELRVTRQCQSASLLARRLADHPAVAAVHHPSLPDHPDHAVAARLMRHAGGVLSFEVRGGGAQAGRVADGLLHFVQAPSLGGVTSVVSWPAGVSHVGLSPEERARTGVAEGLLRLAVGIEPVDVLWEDLSRALDASA